MSSPMTTRSETHESIVESLHAPTPVAEPLLDLSPGGVDPEFTEWFQAIVDQFEGPLLRYACRITKDLERARDVVQETLLQVCRQDRNALRGALAPWLFRVCRNRALDVQRKEQQMSTATDFELEADSGKPGPAEQLVLRETRSRLLGLLECLTENQQEVIRLKFQNDLSYRAIAEITGLTVSNVGVLLHAGLKKLRSLMKDGDSVG